MKNYRLPYLIIFAMIMTLSACSSTEKKSASNDNAELIAAYLGVKNALVKTDAKLAGEDASKMARQIGDSQDEMLVKLKADALAIANTDDVAKQREKFNTMSQNIYNYVKQIGGEKQGLYKQYCPMAFNDTGAFWLSAEKEVNNPYFGSMMLHCGVVKEEI